MIKEISIAVIAAITTAVAFWFFSKLGDIPGEITIPKGAVVAFNATSCPDSWSPYNKTEGRIILGTGNKYALEQQGGDFNVSLKLANLPSHKHDTLVAAQQSYSIWGNASSKTSVWGAKADDHVTAYTSPEGGSQPFEVIPPFVSLRFCQKN